MPVIQLREQCARKEKEEDRLLLHLSLEMDRDFVRKAKEMEHMRMRNAGTTAQYNHEKALEKEAREANKRKEALHVPMGNIFANRDSGPDRVLQGRQLSDGLQEQISAKQIRQTTERLEKEREDRVLRERLAREVKESTLQVHMQKLHKQHLQQTALAEQIQTLRPPPAPSPPPLPSSAENPFARSESLMFLYQKEKAKQLYQEQMAIIRQKREYEARVREMERKHSLERLALSRRE
ncbi:hypothetical protein HK097_005773 [Rhizophlyctis rosea]|uniref:Uncharacterized protein n=1 Tax=Rhizophlyctis rosea TaxID=64517 RepID=A0AAD5X2D0_9FUNG|nr:hypothetical protein HK097_005773 [Rhizophlyctis rosea]